ncbi:recombinase family protein [Amnibacterium kyonggiense]|uniref:DNA invertase Pin-like site-specific DNA recombinase n=1 Tax=Amnibacterium kyonggiense TaxID=595671 RepID=A0A4R7FHJ3_9MICO|nr:recombinase family protein [Amnibacterium kyonggiense]TDS74499.1 DNA invertase Pin-like site-specific DNA recombinase [Amnibacterium kyonggiense]
MSAPLRAAIYARISKEAVDVPKIENQEALCAAMAEDFNYTVIGNYADDAISGYKPVKNRPGMDALIADVLDGKIDVILAREQTRFARSDEYRARLVRASRGAGAVWHTKFEGLTDPGTADGKLQIGIRGEFAEFESARLSERVRAANDARIKHGKPIVTRRPFGYEADGVTQNEKEARALRWAIDHLLAGGKTYRVLKQFEADNITPVISRRELTAAAEENREPVAPRWSYGTIDGILLRPGNYGLLVHRGKVVGPGSWEGIGTADEYKRMLTLMRDPTRSVAPSREPKHLMSGVLVCGTCGGPMFRTTQANRHDKTKRLAVYRCIAPKKKASPMTHACIMQATVDTAVVNAVAARFLMVRDREELTASDTSEVGVVQQMLSEVRAAKEELVSLLGTPGFKAQFAKKSNELNAEEERLQARLDQIAGDAAKQGLAGALKAEFWARMTEHRPKNGDGFADMTNTFEEVVAAFGALPLDQQKAIVKSMMTVTVGRGQGMGRIKIVVHAEQGVVLAA